MKFCTFGNSSTRLSLEGNLNKEEIMQETKTVINGVSFISELHDGKRAALQQLFDKYYKPLCNYAYRIVEDKCMSEDIVAVSFDKIWRRRKNFDTLSGLL